MSDKIGVLGEASTLTAGTVTVYTCPAAKAAKGKLFLRGQGATDDTSDIDIAVNGITILTKTNITNTNYMFSNDTIQAHLATQAPDGSSATLTASPGPSDYYLSAGDTVTYTIAGSSFRSLSIQFVGTEIDV